VAHLFNELGYWAQLAHRVEKIPNDGGSGGESDMGDTVREAHTATDTDRGYRHALYSAVTAEVYSKYLTRSLPTLFSSLLFSSLT
jgi:hypothetical protein